MVTGNATVAYNGWAVDRLQERVWGYYGRYNDGTFAEATQAHRLMESSAHLGKIVLRMG
jgi:hypothetical protein